jgi:hypothetical protein
MRYYRIIYVDISITLLTGALRRSIAHLVWQRLEVAQRESTSELVLVSSVSDEDKPARGVEDLHRQQANLAHHHVFDYEKWFLMQQTINPTCVQRTAKEAAS